MIILVSKLNYLMNLKIFKVFDSYFTSEEKYF